MGQNCLKEDQNRPNFVLSKTGLNPIKINVSLSVVCPILIRKVDFDELREVRKKIDKMIAVINVVK